MFKNHKHLLLNVFLYSQLKQTLNRISKLKFLKYFNIDQSLNISFLLCFTDVKFSFHKD